MTRNRYEQQLADIKSRTTNLGNNAERLVELSVKALKGQDAELAQQVINMDNDLDHDYLKLEERIMRVIAMQAPVAGDLRMLLTALKNATDIERLGDYAKDIAEITIALKDRQYFTP
ncbi:MAG: PhoU domain-containing protein, partial [Candidatus Methanofastidiosa archaeon]|nr:PhoU domain-containing protein [Candidatus Methanofastidiosa archaeon]